MKKVLLLSVCLIASFLFGGGKSWASVKITETDGSLTISVIGTASDDDVTEVKNKMNSSSYTKVVVTGGVIGDKFIQGIVYPNGSANTNLTTLDLSGTSYSSTTFAKTAFYIADDRAWMLNNLKIATLSFPGNITTIAKEAVAKMENLEEVIFPENLDKIEDAAFCNCYSLKNLKFNSKLRYIGNSAFAANRGIIETTIVIPASVKYIGPAAFFGHQYQDVYFMSDRAPVMPNGAPVGSEITAGEKECTAFDSYVLMLNNGFADNQGAGSTRDDVSTGYANRENYVNHGAYMAILHYPNTITSVADLKTYYDTTRKYETKTKEDGTFDKNSKFTVGQESTTLQAFGVSAQKDVNTGYKDTYVGDSYIWPSQNQWMRSYITAVNGVEWNGVTQYRTTLQEWEKKVLAEAGYTSPTYSDDSLAYIAHLGTRMFVLANNDSRKDDYVINMEGGKWWTLCVPFNMTKKQVTEVFGDKTNVCLFNNVKRVISQTSSKIHLYFTVDVCQEHKCTPKNATTSKWDYSTINDNAAPADDDIVIYAHEAYMIRPSKTNEDAKFVVNIADYDIVTGNPQPTLINSVETEYVQQDDTNGPEYRFVGNYIGNDTATDGVQTVKVPKYSYAYATNGSKDSKGNKIYKFWFLTGDKMVWRANKCVVQSTDRSVGAEDEERFFGGNASGAKQASYFGSTDGGDGTTSVDEYVIIAGEKADAPIYSVEGSMVSHDGDTTGLAKGVYIQNGKKFVVK